MDKFSCAMIAVIKFLLIFITLFIVTLLVTGLVIKCNGKTQNVYYTEFFLFEAKDMHRIEEADYTQMRLIDTDEPDGTDKSVYFFLGDTLIKSGKVEYITALKCSQGNHTNKFGLVKREKDRYYTLIRLTHNEKGTVVIGER